MKATSTKRNASRIYLLLVPLLVIIFGFALGKISYTLYLPIWIGNVFLMITAAWVLDYILLKIKQKKSILHLEHFL